MIEIVHGDALATLAQLRDECIDMIYTDPPFNTGNVQAMRRTRNYGEVVSTMEFSDVYASHNEYLYMLGGVLEECWRVLKPNGTMYVHLDYREVHYVKVMCDMLFGRDKFLNEIIWAFDYGGRSKIKFSPKHNTILSYVKDPKNYIFNYDAVERIPYMSPDLVGPEKTARGKTITDTWWHTIVPTNGKERVGYPNQKPIGIVRRMIEVSTNKTNPISVVLDPFAGSGTLGAAAAMLGRDAIMIDRNPQAITTMRKRYREAGYAYVDGLV